METVNKEILTVDDQNLSYLHDYKFTLIAKTPAQGEYPAGLELLIWVCVNIIILINRYNIANIR